MQEEQPERLQTQSLLVLGVTERMPHHGEEGEPQASQVTPLGRRMVRSDSSVHRVVNWTGK